MGRHTPNPGGCGVDCEMKGLLFILLQVVMAQPAQLKADFVQEKQNHDGTTIVSKGHMEYQHTGYIRWEYTEPVKMVWEIDPKKPDTNQSPQVKEMVGMIRACIEGKILEQSDMYEARWEGETLILIPKKRSMRAVFERLEIWFDAKTGLARKVTLKEKSGDVTGITFSL